MCKWFGKTISNEIVEGNVLSMKICTKVKKSCISFNKRQNTPVLTQLLCRTCRIFLTYIFYIKKAFSSYNLLKIKTICPLRGPFWNCFWSFIGAKLLLAIWRERIVDAKFSLLEINVLDSVETYCIFQNKYIYSHTFFDAIIFFYEEWWA